MKKRRADKGEWSDFDGVNVFALPVPLIRHPNFLKLSPQATKLLFDLGRQFSGRNNGYLSAAMTLLGPMGWRSESTVREALAELMHYQLIQKTRQGGRHRCSLYAMTWRRIHAKEGVPLEVDPTSRPSAAWNCDPDNFVKPTRKKKNYPRTGST